MQTRGRLLLRNINNHKYIYILLVPAIIQYIVFMYVPMYGVTLAFKDFMFNKGVLGSPWVGLSNFSDIFRLPDFWNAFKNTIIISFSRILFEFPIPIIIAFLLNEVRNSKIKRIFQTIYTFPYFISWIVVTGIVFSLLSNDGFVNHIIVALGGQKVNLLVQSAAFRPLLYITDSWKNAGWGTIIYLAAMSSLNPELYDAGAIDGASRFQQMKHITWAGIRGTVAILLILQVGNAMNAGYDQILNMYNPSVQDVSDILDTFIYRRSFFLGADYGTSTAIGLFKSIINFTLLFTANYIVKKFGEEGIV
jgi:putative aldouronate transport system permease protein